LLDDPDARVRAAATRAAGKLTLRPAAGPILKLARDPDAEVRRASLEALRRLGEARAVPVAVTALGDPETALKALEFLGELGGPDHLGPVTELARRYPSAEVLPAVGKVLTGWAARKSLTAARRQEIESALAEIHGGSGVLLGWYVRGPISPDAAGE